MPRPRRIVTFYLEPEPWDRLVAEATRESRDPFAQARWLVLRALDQDIADKRAESGERAAERAAS